jgi:deazaflavin-dependent oxidoreductase (nitroreductase family)
MRRALGVAALVVGATVASLAVAELAYERTSAFRHGNRLYYREGRATGPGRAFGRVWMTLASWRLTPPFVVGLETVGYRTGRTSSIPVVLADLGGARYVVSMLGERPRWVRNVRAADGRAVLRRGDRRDVQLVEVPPGERAPILKAYLDRAAGARPHFPIAPGAPLEDFERIAPDYPVFRVEEV